MYLILCYEKQVMTVLGFIFGDIWQISCRRLSSTLVITNRSQWLIPCCFRRSSSKTLSWDWHIHQRLVAYQFSDMWSSLVPGSRILSGSMYLDHAASGEIVLLKCLQLSSNTPQNTCARQSAPTFHPALSCLATPLLPRPCHVFLWCLHYK